MVATCLATVMSRTVMVMMKVAGCKKLDEEQDLQDENEVPSGYKSHEIYSPYL